MINLITSWGSRLDKLIWDTELVSLTRWGQRGIATLRIVYLTVRDVFFDSQLTLRSMSLVYTTLLSLVPLLAVSVSVLKGFGAHNQLELALRNFLTPLGQRGEEITSTIIKFVEGISSGLLGSLGIAMLLYTVISLMQKIESAFNFTWRVTEDRSFARRFSDYLSVILIGPVLVFTAMGLTATVGHSKIFLLLTSSSAIGFMLTLISHLLPYFLIILAFTVIYIYIPNTKVRFGSALIGATVAGVLWQTVGWLFASFVSSANYTAIYSAFATLFFFMIWLYISWTILLIGASIAFYYQNPEFRSRQRRQFSLSSRMKEKLAFAVMARVATQYYQRQPALSLQDLAQDINIASDMLHTIIDNLIARKLLVRTDSEPAGLIPASAPETMQLAEILRAVREGGEDGFMNAGRITLSEPVEAIFQNYQAAASGAMDGKTLKDLAPDVDNSMIERTSQLKHSG